jgi:beta-lactamase superfamily II metal-dependent hydrolase
MESMLDMIATYTGGPLTPPPEFPGASFRLFHNSYGSDFQDTNNMSVVTFLECGSTKFIIPGDLEKKGWLALLAQKEFVNQLVRVNVFIASHDGRDNGYCKEVFDHCSPHVVIFSDSEVEYETQDMSKTYAAHATGIAFNGEKRFVLSTRNDRSLTWTF